jgi:hypothetical protein
MWRRRLDVQGDPQAASGDLLAIENGQVKEWRYWRLPTAIDRSVSEAEWIERVQGAA